MNNFNEDIKETPTLAKVTDIKYVKSLIIMLN